MDLPTIDDRLSALESENAALRAELADIRQHGIRKSAIPAPAPSNLERPVTISTPAPVSSFAMPSESELTVLIDAVALRYPALMDTTSSAFTGTRAERRQQWRKNFEACFLAIGNLRRIDSVNSKVYLSYWTDTAASILVGLGHPRTTLFGHCFQAAALSHYDVAISGIGRLHEGVQVELGLHQWVGRPATDQWRRIIEGAAPREVAPAMPVARPSPASVWQY